MGHGTVDFKREFLSAHSSPLSVGHGEGPGGAAHFKVFHNMRDLGQSDLALLAPVDEELLAPWPFQYCHAFA